MKKFNIKALICLVLSIFSLSLTSLAAETEYAACDTAPCEDTHAVSESVQVGSRLWDLLLGERKGESRTLCPGGGIFGVKIKQSTVTVIESKGIPALSAGDTVISINGTEVRTAEQVRRLVEASEGESLTIRAMHGDTAISLEVRPTLVDGKYRLGVSLRDGAAGIGTVTFIDPETGLFGGLGHGICDSDSGRIVEMESGEICRVILGGIHKGECGKPGELSGILTDEHLGILTKNNECGVFGTMDVKGITLPDAIEIGTRRDVHNGEATIISTLKNGMRAEYKIEIFDVDHDSTGTKSFRIRVTDPTLTAITGGIVRGMSGSPIIQDGKLVGAVTHVMVADPTEGYGIFIENMLSAVENTVSKAA